MALLPIPEIVPFRAPQGIHLLLAVGISTAFCNLIVFWVGGSGPSWPGAPLGLVYAIILGLWTPWRLRTRQGPLLKLWIWVVATLLLYGGLALIDGRPWPETFGPEGQHLAWFFPGFVQGQITALWAGQLASRARLYQLIDGIPSGRLLEERVRDFQLDADFSHQNAATLSGSLMVLSFFVVAAATFSPFGKDGTSAVLAGGFVVFCLFLGVLLRVYRREMGALMYGRRFAPAEKIAPLGWSLVLLVVSGLGAWGLMALGGPWVDWDHLLQGNHILAAPELPEASVPTRPAAEPLRAGDYKLAVLLALLEQIFQVRNLLAVVEWLIRAATWAVPMAIVTFLVWPLVRWVLSGGRETKGLGHKWWRLLVAQGKAFREAIAGWWRRPFLATGPLTSASSPQEWIRSLFRRPAPGRRKPFPEVVEAFLKLVRWAEPITLYHQGETTREYLDRLAELLPRSVPELALIRDLLERELFGLQGLDSPGRKRFLGLIAALTLEPPSHDSAPGVS